MALAMKKKLVLHQQSHLVPAYQHIKSVPFILMCVNLFWQKLALASSQKHNVSLRIYLSKLTSFNDNCRRKKRCVFFNHITQIKLLLRLYRKYFAGDYQLVNQKLVTQIVTFLSTQISYHIASYLVYSRSSFQHIFQLASKLVDQLVSLIAGSLARQLNQIVKVN